MLEVMNVNYKKVVLLHVGHGRTQVKIAAEEGPIGKLAT